MAVDAVQPDTRYTLPDAKTLQEVGDLTLLDESGKTITFKQLLEDEAHPRQLIVFVRHFYCGLCEAYVQELNQHLSQSKLDALTPATRLTIIGCGQLAPVADWKKRTQCTFPIYCDPDRKIYSKLGMVVNLGLGDRKPEYLKASVFSTTWKSAWNAITGGRKKALTAGNYAQNGGELVFEHGELKWCHRMQNTRDHAEIAELQEVLGLSA